MAPTVILLVPGCKNPADVSLLPSSAIKVQDSKMQEREILQVLYGQWSYCDRVESLVGWSFLVISQCPWMQ
eukprot:4017471-Amphidinium_carterae.1